MEPCDQLTAAAAAATTTVLCGPNPSPNPIRNRRVSARLYFGALSKPEKPPKKFARAQLLSLSLSIKRLLSCELNLIIICARRRCKLAQSVGLDRQIAALCAKLQPAMQSSTSFVEFACAIAKQTNCLIDELTQSAIDIIGSCSSLCVSKQGQHLI